MNLILNKSSNDKEGIYLSLTYIKAFSFGCIGGYFAPYSMPMLKSLLHNHLNVKLENISGDIEQITKNTKKNSMEADYLFGLHYASSKKWLSAIRAFNDDIKRNKIKYSKNFMAKLYFRKSICEACAAKAIYSQNNYAHKNLFKSALESIDKAIHFYSTDKSQTEPLACSKARKANINYIISEMGFANEFGVTTESLMCEIKNALECNKHAIVFLKEESELNFWAWIENTAKKNKDTQLNIILMGYFSSEKNINNYLGEG